MLSTLEIWSYLHHTTTRGRYYYSHWIERKLRQEKWTNLSKFTPRFTWFLSPWCQPLLNSDVHQARTERAKANNKAILIKLLIFIKYVYFHNDIYMLSHLITITTLQGKFSLSLLQMSKMRQIQEFKRLVQGHLVSKQWNKVPDMKLHNTESYFPLKKNFDHLIFA